MPDTEKPTCFIIMPLSMPEVERERYWNDSDHFAHVLEHLFTPAVENAGFTVLPAIMTGADVIHAEIIRRLETANLVLADMSVLNANVFFELGIRTSLDLPVCLVRDQQTTRVPFDTNLINHHVYDGTLSAWTIQHEITRLAEHIKVTAERSGGRNTLWRYFGLTRRGTVPEESTRDEKLDFILQSLQAMQRPGPPTVADTATGSRLSLEQLGEFLTGAQAIAKEVSASLKVAEIGYDRVTFDLGRYMLSPLRFTKIAELGRRYGLEVAYLRNELAGDFSET